MSLRAALRFLERHERTGLPIPVDAQTVLIAHGYIL